MNTSLIGKILYNFEKNICHNLKLFIGKHERTTEIIFLLLYILLQCLLALVILEQIVTLIIICFLFLLALERIFVHIGLDYRKEQLENREEISKEKYEELRFTCYNKINYLKGEIIKLNERLKKQR